LTERLTDRRSVAAAIYAAAHIEGEFLLRSGTVATEYFDKYLFEADPILLRRIAEGLVSSIPDDTQALAGLELGGVPIAVMLSQLTGIPALFVRKQAKTYGTCRLAEGGDVSGRRLLIVEDVVTTGGQIILSAADLRAQGAVIERALCVIDREAGGTEKLAEAGIALTALFGSSELVRSSLGR
jgi:orotate phosphoribosyltransferase